jgi:DNA-binding MarR family transcriptional regulator
MKMDKIDAVLVALRRIIRATDLRSKQLVKTAGLTTPQILLLKAIREKGEVAIGELAHDINLSQATVVNILDRLERRGMIYRRRSTRDKRKVHAYLTNHGVEILKKAPTLLQESFIRQFSDLHNWEQTMIIAALERVAHMMGAEHIDASPVLDIGVLDQQGDVTLINTPAGQKKQKEKKA